MLKPDALNRGLVGEIITTFERAGLSIIAMKIVTPSRELADRHYPNTNEWFSIVGQKTHEGYTLVGKDVLKELGTDDKIAIGKMVKGWLIDFLSSGKVVAMVLEGNAAVKNVRRICGHTVPLMADPGSIRGRFSLDSPDAANAEKRPVLNLVHASGEVSEATTEMNLWFPELGK